MKIQWSSNAADRMIQRLGNAKDSLDACRGITETIRTNFTEANPDGSNRTMTMLAADFESSMRKLEAFAGHLEDTARAIRKSDDQFRECENMLGTMAERINDRMPFPLEHRATASRYLDWNTVGYTTMPFMTASGLMPAAFGSLMNRPNIMESIRNESME